MRKIHLLATLSLIAPLAASLAQAADPIESVQFQTSPFASCQDATMISAKDFKKNEEFWKQAIGECGVDVQVLPDTGFFNTMIGKLGGMEDTTRAIAFMEKVGNRAKQYIQLNNELTEQLRHCVLKDEKWFAAKLANATTDAEKAFYDYGGCEDALAKMRDAIKETGPEVRIHAAAVGGTAGPWESIKKGLKYITGTRLAIEAQKPSAEEAKKAAGIVAEEDAKIDAEIQVELKKYMAEAKARSAHNGGKMLDIQHGEGGDFPGWFQNWYIGTAGGASPDTPDAQTALLGAQHVYNTKRVAEHKEKISQNLQKVPVLAYLSSDNPSDTELAAALGKVVDNGNATLAEVNNLLQAKVSWATKGQGGTRTLSGTERAKHMLEIMKFGPVVNEILKEDPAGTCSTATGIANSIANTELRNNAALMVGMLGTMGAAAAVGPAVLGGAAVVSAATPALMATGVGLAFSAGIYTSDYQNYAAAKRRTFGVADTVTVAANGKKGVAVSGIEDFENARDQLIMSAAMSPTDLIGTGVFLKASALTAGAASMTIAKLLQKPIERAALKSALKSKGMKDIAIDGLFKQVQSADPAVAAAAAKRLITETGADPRAVKFVRSAASKGLFLEQNPEAMKSVLKEVKDAKVYSRALQIVENINGAKINAGNRAEALKAAIAGAEFGVTDPKRLAAVISDWDEGLDGLAKTYEVAAKKLSDPKIRGLASVEARQQAAFRSALDDLRAEKPELKAMPDKEWADMRESMMTCPLKPAK